MKETIGQRVMAAVISHQVGISPDRAMKLYVRKQKIHPSWEVVGEELLNKSLSSADGLAVPKTASKNGRPRPRARAARS